VGQRAVWSLRRIRWPSSHAEGNEMVLWDRTFPRLLETIRSLSKLLNIDLLTKSPCTSSPFARIRSRKAKWRSWRRCREQIVLGPRAWTNASGAGELPCCPRLDPGVSTQPSKVRSTLLAEQLFGLWLIKDEKALTPRFRRVSASVGLATLGDSLGGKRRLTNWKGRICSTPNPENCAELRERRDDN
jgi:hypothetical protein